MAKHTIDAAIVPEIGTKVKFPPGKTAILMTAEFLMGFIIGYSSGASLIFRRVVEIISFKSSNRLSTSRSSISPSPL